MQNSKESRDKLLSGVNTLAIVCNQWGDTGKGKFVDYFADWADIIARGTGGANAGHTIRIKDHEYIFHLVPSGILYDNMGKINIIGSGVAFDPNIIAEELEILKKERLSFDNLLFSRNALLVLPQHLVIDRVKEINTEGKIGTTGRGIGPVYTDHYARIGLTVNDLLNMQDGGKAFKEKLKRNLTDKVKLLKLIDINIIKEIMDHPHIGSGRFFDEKEIFNIDEIEKAYREFAEVFKKNIADTESIIRNNIGKKKILLEGAQGNLLSIDIGTYPYVTSSDCSVTGLAKGCGLKETQIDLTLGIVKAPYMTRVGEGPFPTEMGGTESAKWCGTKGINKTLEKEKYPNATVNDADEFSQGIGVRRAGYEYGATTGRPRRTGWLDLPLLKYSTIFSGPHTILTKIDVMDKCEKIKICHAYEYTGDDYQVGEKTLKKGDIIETAIPDKEVISNCKPLYTEFPGWLSDITQVISYNSLPENLITILDFIKSKTGIMIDIISVGPDRDQTIINK
ncbi:MAG: adenylosuccinate synthetase [Patescibacteria group bacterium]